jgi:hypothetical protein
LRRVAVPLDRKSNTPPRGPEPVPQPSRSCEEINRSWTLIGGRYPLPALTAEGDQNALPTLWLLTNANCSTMVDEVNVKTLAHLRGYESLKGVMIRFATSRLHKPEPSEDSCHMGVDREIRSIKSVGHHAPGGFLANPRELHQESLDLAIG